MSDVVIITEEVPGPAGAASTVAGPVGPAGPNGIFGKVTTGTLTAYEGNFDWVTVPGGSTVTVWTMPDGALADRESADLFQDVRIRDTATKRLLDGWQKRIYALNNAGSMLQPNGSAAVDVDVTVTPHATFSLSGLAVSIVVQGTSLGVQVTSPAGIAVDVKGTFSLNRDLALGTAIVPAVQSLSVPAGPTTGGTLTVATGLHFAVPNPMTQLVLDGGACVPGDGVTPGTFLVTSDNTANVCTPPFATAGTGNVVASSVAGSGAALVGGWTYTLGVVPTVTSADVTSGLTAGGTSVPIRGVHFLNPLPITSVLLDGVLAIINAIDSDTLAHVTSTSTSSAGTGDILASSLGGGFPLTNGWTYIGPPQLTAMVLDIGQYEGGSIASGTGTGLLGLTSMVFDGVACDPTTIVIGGSGTTWQCKVPAMTGSHASVNGGYVSVQATNAAGTSNALSGTNGFYYLPSQTTFFFNPRFGTTPAAPVDSTKLTTWLDGTGSAAQQVQATAANDPQYVASSVGSNGQPAVRTSQSGGVGAVPQSFAGTFATPFTATTLTMLWVGSKATTATTDMFEFDTGGAPTSAGAMLVTSGTFLGCFVNGSSVASGNAVTMAANTVYVNSVRFDGVHCTLRTSGQDGGPAASAPTFTAATRFAFGNPQALGVVQADNLFELLSTKAWLAADFASFSAYTNHKWGVASA